MSIQGKLAGASAIIAVAVSVCLPAQSPSPGLAASARLASEPQGPAPQHSAPMELIHDKPYVQVLINGKGPFRFVLDTGTGAEALVTPELANQLALPAAGEVRLTDPSRQGLQRTQLVLIHSLTVAGVEFAGVKAMRHSLAGQDAGQSGPTEDGFGGSGSCQGLLGFTLFRAYLLTLDYPNRRLTLATGRLNADVGPSQDSSTVAFRMPDGVPIATLDIGGLPVDALLDTGGDGLALPERVAAHLRFAIDPTPFANGQSLSTRFEVKAGKLGSDVRIGRYTFLKPFVEINPAFPLANFGSCPLQRFALTFDQKSLLVRFDAERTRFNLGPSPTAIRLANAPPDRPPAPGLVPMG
jgi:predicted aspartyl protease